MSDRTTVKYDKINTINVEFHPVEEPSEEGTYTDRTSRVNWRSSTLACATVAGIVLLLNIALLSWGEAKSRKNGGRRVLYDGNCGTTKKLNVATHLVINVFSTALLGASNYCMQCMSAPTRAEVDRAHAASRWVDIGIPSIRNLRHVSGLRKAIWVLLALSSVPLHLFYNSTVISSLGVYTYSVFSANEAFAQNPLAQEIDVKGKYLNVRGMKLLSPVKRDRLQKLNIVDCLNAYTQTFQTRYGSLFLVAKNGTTGLSGNSPTVIYQEVQEAFEPVADFVYAMHQPYGWVCNQPRCYDLPLETPEIIPVCEDILYSCVRDDVHTWAPFGKPLAYCLAEKLPERCQLRYSMELAVVVICMGLLKTCLMLYIALRLAGDFPLLTVGDAVASFLKRPDDYVKRWCLADRKDARPSSETENPGRRPKPYRAKPQRRFHAVSRARRWMLVLPFVIMLTVSAGLLYYGANKIQRLSPTSSTSSAWDFGLGEVSTRNLIENWHIPRSGTGALAGNFLVVNSPQILFSLLYLSFNGFVTSMAMATEWSQLAIVRKGLRVSVNPKGAQRSTYFLQLPFRIGVPILLVSGIMHWLISQSLFLVKVTAFDPRDGDWWGSSNPDTDDNSSTTCEYSPTAILTAIIVGSVTLIGLLLLGSKRLKSGMPIAGSNSAAIAAACQPGGRAFCERCSVRESAVGCHKYEYRAPGREAGGTLRVFESASGNA